MRRKQKENYQVFPLFPQDNALRYLKFDSFSINKTESLAIKQVKKYALLYKSEIDSYLSSIINFMEDNDVSFEKKVDSFYDLSVILTDDKRKNDMIEDTIRYFFTSYLIDYYNKSKSPFYQMPCMKGIDELIEKHEKEKRLKESILL